MRAFLLILALAAAVHAEPAAVRTPTFNQPIPELRLTNGTVFRNVSVVRYDRERVILKSSAGIGPLLYSYIPEPLRSQMLAERDALRSSGSSAAAKADVAQPMPTVRTIVGEAFISGGVSQAIRVKFAGLHVTAYPLDAAKSALEASGFRPQMPPPLAQTDANAEGAWSLDVPADVPFLLCAKATHRSLIGSNYTDFEWRIPSTELNGNSVMLTEKNALPLSTITIRHR